TEPAPVLHETRPGVPEDLSLSIARCLEKDPENRWPTADALRRGLESRSVSGYRPTFTGMRTGARRPSTTAGARPRPGTSERARNHTAGASPRSPRPPAPRQAGSVARGQWVKNERGEWIRVGSGAEVPVHDTGEPPIVQKVRGQFARWMAVTGGCFLLNVATGITDGPWFLFVAGGMGFPLLKSYSQLWQAGYSWRDVLNRPAAPDAVQVPGQKGKKILGPPRQAEYGKYLGKVEQVLRDRQAILGLMAKLPEADRHQLPDDVVQTADDLYSRSLDLARTLHEMDQSFGMDTPDRIRQKLELARLQESGEERDRHIRLLEQQLKTAQDLSERRDKIAGRLESSILAMQNMRYDLMRLRTAGVGAVLGDLTSATQQARAISRDVDHVIAAASEVREAMG
ncbi:MAG TPA: hypothetical protein VFN96_00670, partial [Gemmatimonadales bacterium]|nr:hypothetical protein [Gemmatimonadales bacterium]